jgi:light-independent protochlorophyllide reductase subunit B
MSSRPAWHPDAEQRLRKVPFFIRPWVRRRAEAVAAERGLQEVTSQLLDEIKDREHKPG